jgi:hypothetical protein
MRVGHRSNSRSFYPIVLGAAMTTELKRFSDAYATAMVATYEPMILRWVSLWGLGTIATDLATRQQHAAVVGQAQLPTAVALSHASRGANPQISQLPTVGAKPVATPPTPVDVDGIPLPTGQIRPAGIPIVGGVIAGGEAFARGVVRRVTGNLERGSSKPSVWSELWDLIRPSNDLANFSPLRTVPVATNPALASLPDGFDLGAARDTVMQEMTDAVDAALASGGSFHLDLGNAIRQSAYHFFPIKVEEALSPVGLAHFYRQLYFNLEEGVGPLEQAFTVAPLETLEVAYVATHTQTHEEVLENASETVSETATEEKNLDEVSDKVSSMIQRDSSAAMSASASGGIGVWQGSAEGSTDIKNSSQLNGEQTSRKLKDLTTRASERLTKSFSIKTRDFDELTATNSTRRIIKNESADPVSYGLRRVLRRVRVKVQELGPQLVWQVYVCEPGAGLARSKFVHFRTPSDIPQPDVPPGAPPRPKGGTETGSTSSTVGHDASRGYFLTLVINAGAGRTVSAVAIDNITDLEGGGKNDEAPAPINDQQWGETVNSITGTYTIKIGIRPGDSASVAVNYTYTWEPGADVLAAWEEQVEILRAQADEERLQQQFERERDLVTEIRRVRSRAAVDLRREERYEVMNRMISQLFARQDNPSEPTPLEIEYFHRYFDLEAMFTWTHPSWWRPRYAANAVGLERPAYSITAASEPAPMGSSLAWAIQLDGDTRRNEFINSPWVRACLPIRAGRERDALAWLAAHVEGERGYDPSREPLKTVLSTIEDRRAEEGKLGVQGPDWVAVDSEVSTSPNGSDGQPPRPEGVYPIISEFDVTVPTEGFVYERLTISGG